MQWNEISHLFRREGLSGYDIGPYLSGYQQIFTLLRTINKKKVQRSGLLTFIFCNIHGEWKYHFVTSSEIALRNISTINEWMTALLSRWLRRYVFKTVFVPLRYCVKSWIGMFSKYFPCTLVSYFVLNLWQSKLAFSTQSSFSK